MRHLTYGEAVPVTIAGTSVYHVRTLCGYLVLQGLADMVPLLRAPLGDTCLMCMNAMRTHMTPAGTED